MDSSRKDIKKPTQREGSPQAPDPDQWLRRQEAPSNAVDPDSTPHARHPSERIDPTRPPENLLQPEPPVKQSLWARRRSFKDRPPTSETKSDKRSLTDPSTLQGRRGSSSFLPEGISAFLRLSNTPESQKADPPQSRQRSPSSRQELHTPDISASTVAGHDGQFKVESTKTGPREQNPQHEQLTDIPVQEAVRGPGFFERTEQHDNHVSHEVISQQLSDHAAKWQEATGKVNKLNEQLEYNQQQQKNIQRKLENDPEYNQHTAAEWQKRYDRVEELEHAYTTASPGAQKREDALLDLEKEFNIESGTATEEAFKSKKREIKLEIDARIEMLGDSKGRARLWSEYREEKERIQTQLAAETANSDSALTEYQDVLKQYRAVSSSHISSREVLSPMQQQEVPVKLNPDELDVLAQVRTRQESRRNELREKEENVAADEKAYDDFQKAKETYKREMQELTTDETSADANKIKISDMTKEYRTTVASLTTTWEQRFGFAPGQSLQQAIEAGEVPRRMREQENRLKRERENLQAEMRSREARESFLKEHVRENPEVVAPIDLSFGGVSSLEGESTLYVPESSQGPRGETSSLEEAAALERVIQPGALEALNTRIADLYASLNKLGQDATARDKRIKALPDTMTKRLRDSEERLNAEETHISVYDKIYEDLSTILEKEEPIRGEISRLQGRRQQSPPSYMSLEQYNNSITQSLERQHENLQQFQAPRADIHTRWSSWKHNDADAQYNLGNAGLDNNSTPEDEIRNAFRQVEKQRESLPSRRSNLPQDIERARAREEATLQEQRSKNELTRKKTSEQYQKALDERDQLLMIQKIQDRQRGVTATDGQEGAATTVLKTTTEQKRQLDQQQAEVTSRLADINETLSFLKNDQALRDKNRASFVAQKEKLDAQREAIGNFEEQYAELSEKISAGRKKITEYSARIQELQNASSNKLISRGSNIPKKGDLTALAVQSREEHNQLTREFKKLNAEWNRQFISRDAVQLSNKVFEEKRASLDREHIELYQKINLLDTRAKNSRQKIAELEVAQKTALSDKRKIEAKLAIVSAEHGTATRRMAKPQGTQKASETSILSSDDLARGENTADKQVVSRERPSIEAGQKINLEEFSKFAAGQEERAQEIEKLVPTHEDFVNLTRAREDLQNQEQAERRNEQQVQELNKKEKELLVVKRDFDENGSDWETRMQAFEARKDEDRTVTEYDSLINEGEQWHKSNLRSLQDKRALERDWVQPLATQKVVREQRALASKNYEETKNVISEKLEQTEREIQQQLQSLETRESRLAALKSELDQDRAYLDNWIKKHGEFLNEAYSPGIIRNAAWEEGFKQRWVTWKNAERDPQDALYRLEASQKPQTILDQEAPLLKARKEEWSSKDNAYRQVSEKLEQERTALAARQSEFERAQALVKAPEGDILAAEFQRLEMRQKQLDISWQEIERDQAHLTKRITDWNKFAEKGKSKFINEKAWQADFAQDWVAWKNEERAPQEQRYTLEPGLSPIRDAVVAENGLLRDRSTKWQERFDNHQKDTQQLEQERAALTARQREQEQAQAFVKAHEGDILADEFRRLEVWDSELDAKKKAIDNDKRVFSLRDRIEQYNTFVEEFEKKKGWRDDLAQRWSNWKNAELLPDKEPYRLGATQSLQSALDQEKATLDTKRKQWEATDKKLRDDDPNYAFFSDRTKKYDALVQEFKENEQWEIGFKKRWVTWKNTEQGSQKEPYRLEDGQSFQSALDQEKATLDASNINLQIEWDDGYQQILQSKKLLRTERASLLAKQSQLERESGVAPDRDMQASPLSPTTAQEAPQRPVQSSHVDQPESSMTPKETQGSESAKVAQKAESIRGLQARLASIRKELHPTLMPKAEEFQLQHRMAADSKKMLDREQGELENAYNHLKARQRIYEDVQGKLVEIISTEPPDLQEQLATLNGQWEEHKIGEPILLDNVPSLGKEKGKGKELSPVTTFRNDLENEEELFAREDQELQKRSLSIDLKVQGSQEEQRILREQQAANIASVTNENHRAKLQEYSNVLTALREHEASLGFQTQYKTEAPVADVPPSPINSPGSEAEASRSSILDNPQPRALRRDTDTERPAILEAEKATPIEKLKALKEQIQALPDDVQKLAKRAEELQQRGQQLDIRKRELDSTEERIEAGLQNLDKKRRINDEIQIEVGFHLEYEKIKKQKIPDGRNKITEKWVGTFGEKDREPFQKVFSQEANKDSLFLETFDLLAQQKTAIFLEKQSVANHTKEWQSQYDTIKRRVKRNANKRGLVQQASHRDILDEHLKLLTTLRSQNLLEQPTSGMLNQLSIGAAETMKRSIGTIRQQQAERLPDTEQAERLPDTDTEMYP